MSGKFNAFGFFVYTQSYQGQLALEYFQDINKYAERGDFLLSFMGVGDWIEAHLDAEEGDDVDWEDISLGSEEIRYIEEIRKVAESYPASNIDEVKGLLVYLVECGAVKISDIEDDVLDLDEIFSNLPLISMGLHLAHPEVFLPYGFVGRYYFVQRISEEFGIALPPVPPKNKRLDRWLFYGQLCLAFREFQKSHNLSLPGLLSFIYDFSPNYVASGISDELPEPRNAWLLIGGVENGDLEWMDDNPDVSQINWQGNMDMRRGDVCIMYIRNPVSATHSIWRVVEDAYEDPFFRYKHTVQIGQTYKIPSISFRKLAGDPLLGENKYFKANLQGASGKVLTHAEYNRFLELMHEEGDLPEGIPRFSEKETVELADLENERDVERKLVEPLLFRAGLEIDEWQQQLSVRMGRGERVYPDYVVGLTGKAPEQRVRVLVEVKYRAAGERDWRDAFLQAKSYGLRLGAKVILTAAAEGVRVYERHNDDFDFSVVSELKWSELQEGERLRWLGRLLKD